MDTTIEIPLTRNMVTLIDAEDIKLVQQYKWYAGRNHYDGIRQPRYYAKTNAKSSNGETTLTTLHRFIMNAPKGLQVDHINGNTLDNRRVNLRLASPTQNSVNRPSQKGSSSSYKGVSFRKSSRKWTAQIQLGTFENEEDAARAYDKEAKRLHGEFAFLNFPDKLER